MPLLTRLRIVPLVMLGTLPFSPSVHAQTDHHGPSAAAGAQAATAPKSGSRQPTPEEELQRAIGGAANDRAALVRNLEAFLKKYPDSAQRPQIYRALVERQPATARHRAGRGLRGANCGAHAGRYVHDAANDRITGTPWR